MRILSLALATTLMLSLGACVVTHGDGVGDDGPPPGGTCDAETQSNIDTNAGFTYTPGVDAGYYIDYLGGGEWHIEWTCDTSISAEGCNFTGTLIADVAPSQGLNATCFECEADDTLTVAAAPAGPAGEAQMAIVFNTQTTSGIDGVDFFTTPGSTVNFDMQINQIYQDDLVYFVVNDQTASPVCGSFELTSID